MDFDEELHQRIEDQITGGNLKAGSKEHGVALKVVHQGTGALNSSQRVIWDNGVEPLLSLSISDDKEFQKALRADQQIKASDSGDAR
jgi:hypothetical protein